MTSRKKTIKNEEVGEKTIPTSARGQQIKKVTKKKNDNKNIKKSVHQKRKKAGYVKTVNEMTKSEMQRVRKKWKFYSKVYRQRQKLAYEKLLAEILNSTSDDPLNISINELGENGVNNKSIKTDKLMGKITKMIGKKASENDPKKIKEMNEKRKLYYIKRRGEGRVKLAKDMSEEEKQRIREHWKKHSQEYRRRKKATQPNGEKKQRGRRKKLPTEATDKNNPEYRKKLQEKRRRDYLKKIEKGKVKMAKDMSPEEKQRAREIWKKCSREYRRRKKASPTSSEQRSNDVFSPTVNDNTPDDMSTWITESLDDSTEFVDDEITCKQKNIIEIEPVNFTHHDENCMQAKLMKEVETLENIIKTESGLNRHQESNQEKHQKFQEAFKTFVSDVQVPAETQEIEASSEILFNVEKVYVTVKNACYEISNPHQEKQPKEIKHAQQIDFDVQYAALAANEVSYDSYDDISIDSAELEDHSVDNFSDELQYELKNMMEITVEKTKRKYKTYKTQAERLEGLQAKRREYYQRRKQEGRTKEVKDMSAEEMQKARDIWKQNSRAYRQRKKLLNKTTEISAASEHEHDDIFSQIVNQLQDEALNSQMEKPEHQSTKKRYKLYKTEEERREEKKERSKKYYLKKKEEGKIKKVKEMNPKEKERLREIWKEHSRAYRQRKKMQQSILLMQE